MRDGNVGRSYKHKQFYKGLDLDEKIDYRSHLYYFINRLWK